MLQPGLVAARIPNIPKHALGDLKATFLSWPVLILAGGAIAAGSLTKLDHALSDEFVGNRRLGKFDDAAEVFGQPYVLGPAALLVFGAGELTHNEQVSLTGETLVESLIFTDLMVGAMKLGFRRTRPSGGHYSFPSGHAAGTFAIATVLETLHGPKWGIPAYAVASLVSFSRIDMNAHFISDVAFGAALGSAIGWGTAHFHLQRNPNFAILPMVPGGTGVTMLYRWQ
jgi:membrane-associated phospholipid phosphatase